MNFEYKLLTYFFPLRSCLISQKKKKKKTHQESLLCFLSKKPPKPFLKSNPILLQQSSLYPCIYATYKLTGITTSNINNQLWPTWHSIQILNQSSQSPPWFIFALQLVMYASSAPKGA